MELNNMSGSAMTDSFLLLSNGSALNTSPLLKLADLVGSGTDIQFSQRTSDPTNLSSGSLWYNHDDPHLEY